MKNKWTKRIKELEQENTTLKKQIDLNEKEANGLTTLIKHKNKEIKELEKQIPTRERIIEVLMANRDSYIINDDMKIADPIVLEENFEQIASEILGEEEDE